MKQNLFLLFSGLLAFGILVLPNHPGQLGLSALVRWPIELGIVLCALLCLGRIRGVATALAAVLVLAIAVKLADLATFSAYNREFNPVVDLFLIQAAFGLIADTTGSAQAWALVVAVVAGLGLLFWVLRRGFKAWARIPLRPWAAGTAFAGCVAAGLWAVAETGHHMKHWRFDASPPGTAVTSRVLTTRFLQARDTATELARFKRDAERDALADMTGRLDLLDGRDVVLIWIESYGRASFDNPLYAETHGQTLRNAEAALQAEGLAMRSGWLTSPTAGGESWLAHGALASGLWTSDNGRYRAVIASDQKWLFHFAREAGYRTSAFMPAISKAWPEKAAMGFDLVFEAKDIPYRGAPFNWVTMPDQFTLATYEGLLPADDRPDFIQVALISSHAPWTPVPDMIAWEAIGDGRAFNEMAAQGPTPKELWKDRDAVRDAYRRSVDYTLRVVFSHVARRAADGVEAAPLIIVAGDHQAAGFVSGSDSKDVPIHMIGPEAVVDRIAQWGWTEGLVPAADSPVRRMDTFRNAFLRAFTAQSQVAERLR